jgi:class I fructose-bisphosphate aldolase
LGGPRTENTKEFLQSMKEVVDAGPAGATVGRNISAHVRPAGMLRALKIIIHEGASVDLALGRLQ